MAIMVHNTLTGAREPFAPQNAPLVTMYVCGVTPYDEVHLGHARAYVTFDVIRRHLAYRGFQVRYIQNFTDVDDKIIARAAERGIAPRELADRYIADYFIQMDRLNVQRADAYPRVTEQIPAIIHFIEELIRTEHAYAAGGDVYFSVTSFAGYGKLSKRSFDNATVSRITHEEHKRDPLDFALWKAAKPGEPAEVTWESPWGSGRPGWHIECSVMSTGMLGPTIDIHGGGQDLIFPHHENEIAQSEACTGHPFVRCWIHNGFVTVNREKMSKSLGNFFTLREIFERYDPRVVRYFLLSQHYRTPLDFSDDKLRAAAAALQGIDTTLRLLDERNIPAAPADTANPSCAAFNDGLDDDFNTEKALAAVHSLKSTLMARATAGEQPAALAADTATLRDMLARLGIIPPAPDTLPAEVLALKTEREAARTARDWKRSDELRARIGDLGYTVEDRPGGTSVVVKKI